MLYIYICFQKALNVTDHHLIMGFFARSIYLLAFTVFMISDLHGHEISIVTDQDGTPPCPVHSGFSVAQYPLCMYDQLQLINASWNACFFEWYFNGALFSYDEHPALQISSPGCHHIMLISSDFTCSDTSEMWIDVNQLYHAQYCVYLCPGEVYLFAGHELSMSGIYTAEYTTIAGCDSIIDLFLQVDTVHTGFVIQGNTAMATPGNNYYQWCDCANGYTPIPGATGHQFTPVATGAYALVTGNLTCEDTSACQHIVVTGLEDPYGTGRISLYPNPASGYVMCQNLQPGINFEAVLITPDGRIISLMQVSSDNMLLDLRGIPHGVYLLRLSAPGIVPISRRLKIE